LFAETDPSIEDVWNAPHVDVHVAFTRLLRSAVSLGHGGWLAFLPDVARAPVRMTHPLEVIDLGAALLNAWGAECAVWAAYRRDVESVLRAAEAKRVSVQHWLRLLKTAAHFTAADGCVVFDKTLRLYGFGGVIKVEKQNGGQARRCVDLHHDRETSREDVLRGHGTRHSSAFDLCEAVAGAVVFVISQDGDLRLFASDESTVYCAAGLHP
jgi:hypothetical protein